MAQVGLAVTSGLAVPLQGETVVLTQEDLKGGHGVPLSIRPGICY